MRWAIVAAVGIWFVGGEAARADQRAWVELTASGPQARVETTESRCPSLDLDGRMTPMQVRAGPDAAFPTNLCQLDIPVGTKRASLGLQTLPLPHGPPQRILIFGDTGCRLKGLAIQDCNDPKAWPFPLVVRRALERKPDLVIHVGDYYYRETPCPEGHAGCAGSPYGDAWATWKAEFFDPARPLLNAAPWVFVRGNHESCTRGGKGWFRQLDAGPRPLACPAMSAPFRVALGDLNLYVLDSADAEDRGTPSEAVAAVSAQFNAIKGELAQAPGWIVTHRPIWALTPIARVGPVGPFELSLNATEDAAVKDKDLAGAQMIVSGHIHHFAAYDFYGRRPSQLVAGTGGDIGEDADTPAIREGDVQIDNLSAHRITFERYGYLLLDRAGDDWVGAFWDLKDRVVAACRLHQRRLSCGPAGTAR